MVKQITTENFTTTVINADKPVVIDFFAEWCGPCRQMAPAFTELANELKESYVFGKVDIDQDRNLAINHGIASIPTLVFYKSGKQIGSISGFMSKQEIAKKLVAVFGQ